MDPKLPSTASAAQTDEKSGLIAYAPQTYETSPDAESRLRALGASDAFLATSTSHGGGTWWTIRQTLRSLLR